MDEVLSAIFLIGGIVWMIYVALYLPMGEFRRLEKRNPHLKVED